MPSSLPGESIIYLNSDLLICVYTCIHVFIHLVCTYLSPWPWCAVRRTARFKEWALRNCWKLGNSINSRMDLCSGWTLLILNHAWVSHSQPCMGQSFSTVHGSVILNRAWVSHSQPCMGQSFSTMHGSVILNRAWVSHSQPCMGQSFSTMHGSVILNHAWVSQSVSQSVSVCSVEMGESVCVCSVEIVEIDGSVILNHAWVSHSQPCMGQSFSTMHGSVSQSVSQSVCVVWRWVSQCVCVVWR